MVMMVITLGWLVACGLFYGAGYYRGRAVQIREELDWSAEHRRGNRDH